MNSVKEINVKNCMYYFYDDIIQKSYENFLVYYTGYVTIKDLSYARIDSENPLSLITNNINRYIEESKRNKYLTLVPTDETKKVWKTMEKYPRSY